MGIKDKYGFPVALIYNAPVKNILRVLIHGNIKQTYIAWKSRKIVKVYPPLNTWGYMDSEETFYDDTK